MRRTTIFVSTLLVALVFSQALVLQAQDKEKTFYGNFMFGYRTVDTSGASDKYKEHINLDKGVRLFNFNLTYIATDDLKKLFDRFTLNVNNFGGDPFETFHLSLQKFGRYKFQYDRKKSEYFYNDLQTIGSVRYDAHSLDFSRISDSGLFNLTLSNNFSVYINFDHSAKSGTSAATFDINGIEFLMDKPLSEKFTETTVGLDLHVNRYSLVFEEKFQDYKNANSLFLPGYTDGGLAADYPSSLSAFRLNQPYDFKTNVTSFRFNARPFDGLLIRGTAQLSDQDTHLTYSEEAIGTDSLNRDFTTAAAGKGEFNRKIQLYDFDATYLIFNRMAIVGAVRYNTFKQNGSLTTDGDREAADFGFNTLGIEAGLQYEFTSKFVLTAGYRNEQRKLENLETVTYEEKTVKNGLFGNLKWDLKNLKMTLDYQHGNYNDPFTLISPTLFDRLRATARYQLKSFSVSASYLMTKTKNDIPGGVNFRIIYSEDGYGDLWKASNNQFNLRLGYNAAKITASVGYSYIDFKSETDRLIAFNPYWTGPAGTFLWSINYEGKSTLLDASFSYALDKGWTIGAFVNSYTNSGFWPIDRTTLKAYIEYTLASGYVTQISYRYVNFKEKDSGFNDYKASILEFSFGYRWE